MRVAYLMVCFEVIAFFFLLGTKKILGCRYFLLYSCKIMLGFPYFCIWQRLQRGRYEGLMVGYWLGCLVCLLLSKFCINSVLKDNCCSYFLWLTLESTGEMAAATAEIFISQNYRLKTWNGYKNKEKINVLPYIIYDLYILMFIRNYLFLSECISSYILNVLW